MDLDPDLRTAKQASAPTGPAAWPDLMHLWNECQGDAMTIEEQLANGNLSDEERLRLLSRLELVDNTLAPGIIKALVRIG